MSNGVVTFPFQRPLVNAPPYNCYDTTQPVCHRQIVMCVVYADHVEYYCPVHAPAGAVAGVPPVEPEPAKAPVTFPEP